MDCSDLALPATYFTDPQRLEWKLSAELLEKLETAKESIDQYGFFRFICCLVLNRMSFIVCEPLYQSCLLRWFIEYHRNDDTFMTCRLLVSTLRS